MLEELAQDFLAANAFCSHAWRGAVNVQSISGSVAAMAASRLSADAGSQVSARRLRASSSAALHHLMIELVPVLPLFDYCVQEIFSTCCNKLLPAL